MSKNSQKWSKCYKIEFFANFAIFPTFSLNFSVKRLDLKFKTV